MTNKNVLAACMEGIDNWKKAFNAQDAKGCAEQYTEGCIMHARPFGTFERRAAIEEFWQGIIDQGFEDVSYTDVSWESIGSDGYILSAKWTMNKAFGVIHREHWVVDSDGKARLVSDDFEVLGDR
ncbi:nuclear transport factor 2 family protein [Enterovibrio coralii]|uniref:Isochorismatase n=1 Tax=Enterovibrio coralii TaxID=294935 RepID=A0A135IAZ8_9GAMM|nr:nuclear transport factor 2 family protein [Enterovibrio coralii]KXF82631.1 isochorismatase [Enterovibrio coralii]